MRDSQGPHPEPHPPSQWLPFSSKWLHEDTETTEQSAHTGAGGAEMDRCLGNTATRALREPNPTAALQWNQRLQRKTHRGTKGAPGIRNQVEEMRNSTEMLQVEEISESQAERGKCKTEAQLDSDTYMSSPPRQPITAPQPRRPSTQDPTPGMETGLRICREDQAGAAQRKPEERRLVSVCRRKHV